MLQQCNQVLTHVLYAIEVFIVLYLSIGFVMYSWERSGQALTSQLIVVENPTDHSIKEELAIPTETTQEKDFQTTSHQRIRAPFILSEVKQYKFRERFVVFVDTLPIPVPKGMKRYRFRGKEVVRVGDLEKYFTTTT